VRAMTGLSRMFLTHKTALSEIELNPLMVFAAGHGVSAVDVRVARRMA
jgi:succinyl-CoA synthetase beta subunit